MIEKRRVLKKYNGINRVMATLNCYKCINITKIPQIASVPESGPAKITVIM